MTTGNGLLPRSTTSGFRSHDPGLATVGAAVIRLIGFESSPIERVHLEITGDDIRVLEWLRGRTYKLPELLVADQAENNTLGLGNGPTPTLTSANVRGFLQRLWDATGHMRCCADPQRTPHA